MIYLFDTNAITDLLRAHPEMVERVREHQDAHTLCLCQPIDYEIQRGLRWRAAEAQYRRYLNDIRPRFQWVSLADADWLLAGEFWAKTRSQGKQLSDIDLLIAALAIRLDSIIISNDGDFDTLPVLRENWRNP